MGICTSRHLFWNGGLIVSINTGPLEVMLSCHKNVMDFISTSQSNQQEFSKAKQMSLAQSSHSD